MPNLLRRHRAPSAPRPRVQPRQLHADAGNAESGGAVAADQPVRAKVVTHGRYVTFQMAEIAVPRQMFVDILSLIARLRAPPAPA
jgi:hypothetical protein